MSCRTAVLPALVLTSIVGIAILSCSAVANLPNPFSTATPTATATFTPTNTPSPTPTFIPTATPPPTGMLLQDAPDGSHGFFDYDGGYTLDISADWLPFQLDAQDIQDVISQLGGSNPALADALKTLQDMQPGVFRIAAYDKQPSHYSNGFVANFTVLMMPGSLTASMPLDVLITASLDQAHSQYPGLTSRQLETRSNVHGLPIGAAEIQMPVKLPNGKTITTFEKQLYFQTKSTYVVITFAAYKGNAQVILPSFDKLIDGIELIQP